MVINKMILKEDLIQKKMAMIEQVRTEFNIEDIKEVIKLLKEKFTEVSERPSSKGKNQNRIFNTALGMVAAELGTVGGERFDILILGYSNPRDWNATDREAVLTAWEKGPKARANLKKAGQVITMQKAGKPVVVSRIDKWTINKNKKFTVLAGKEIEEGELPIAKDTKEFLADGKTINNRQGSPLDERWSINMYGFAETPGGFVQFEGRIYSDEYAKPTSNKFLGSIAPAFNTYKAVFTVDEDKSTKDILKFKYLNAIDKTETEKSIDNHVYDLIDLDIIKSYKPQKGEVAKEDKDKIFLVDLDDIIPFHEEVMAKRNDKGEVIKTKSNYDKTYFNRVGVGIFQCYSASETKNGNLSLRFIDWTGKKNGGFSGEATPDLDVKEFIDLPQECIICFNTTRKPSRWDAENKVQVDDLINGDVSLGTLLGVKILGSQLDKEEEKNVEQEEKNAEE